MIEIKLQFNTIAEAVSFMSNQGAANNVYTLAAESNPKPAKTTKVSAAELAAGIRAAEQEMKIARANGNIDKADVLCLHLDAFREQLADLLIIERAQNT